MFLRYVRIHRGASEVAGKLITGDANRRRAPYDGHRELNKAMGPMTFRTSSVRHSSSWA